MFVCYPDVESLPHVARDYAKLFCPASLGACNYMLRVSIEIVVYLMHRELTSRGKITAVYII